VAVHHLGVVDDYEPIGQVDGCEPAEEGRWP